MEKRPRAAGSKYTAYLIPLNTLRKEAYEKRPSNKDEHKIYVLQFDSEVTIEAIRTNQSEAALKMTLK